jgi:hypothetical protein
LTRVKLVGQAWYIKEDGSPVNAADSGQLRAELAELLHGRLPVLRSLDVENAVDVESQKAVPSRWRKKRRGEPVPAWELSYGPSHQVIWLGIDANAYSYRPHPTPAHLRFFHWLGGTKIRRLSAVSLAELEPEKLEAGIVSLKRGLRIHAPEHALPERIQVFGAVFTAVPRRFEPRDRDAFLQARRQERQREAADDEGAGAWASPAVPRRPGPVSGRSEQIRYLFISWLYDMTRADWRPPEEFFGTPAKQGRAGRPGQPDVPFASGGPVRPGEVAMVIGPLVRDGLAEWVDDYPPSVCSCRYRPKLVLTGTGLRYAADLRSRFATPQHARGLRAALLSWAGHRAKPPGTVPLDQFLATPSSVVSGIPTTPRDLHMAARWLIRRGYLREPDSYPPGVGLTSKGLQCLDYHEGDPEAMSKARYRADDHRTFTFHGPTGNVAIDSGHVTQHSGSIIQHAEVDTAALRRFAEAVAQALPALNLGDSGQAADVLTAEIISEAAGSHPDHARLRALGRSLRAILEGAAGNALAAGLLSLWRG